MLCVGGRAANYSGRILTGNTAGPAVARAVLSRHWNRFRCGALPENHRNAPETASGAAASLPQLGLPETQLTASASIPVRYQLVLATSLAFWLSNMDKVCMSVAIIPMAIDMGWSSSMSGFVQASFFWGYMLAQLPGGYFASTWGGARLLPAGVALWSAATCALPLMGASVPGLCVSRAAVGLGEAVAPSAAIDMVARGVPPGERSRATSFIFGGLHLGSITGLLAAPWLIHTCGWRALFYLFGGAGLTWAAGFLWLMRAWQQHTPEFVAQMRPAAPGTGSSTPPGVHSLGGHTCHEAEAGGQWHHGGSGGNGTTVATSTNSIASSSTTTSSSSSSSSGSDGGGVMCAAPGSAAAGQAAGARIPYRAFLRSRPVQALCCTHFAHNWLHYTMLSWLPTYFSSSLSVDLAHAAQTALLPPLAGLAAAASVGPVADSLLARGMPLPRVRKLVQGVSFLAPMAFLLAACSPAVMSDRTATVACITAALGLSSCSLAGMYCTHADMSPKYASALMGLTNTFGAVPGIIGVATVGQLYDATHSWPVALFMPSAVCMVLGAYVYTQHARNELIDFDQLDDSPFPFELAMPWANLHHGRQSAEGHED